jgi:hypothetical protein
MAEIALARGLVAIVDDSDYPMIAAHTWTAVRRPRTCYAGFLGENPRKPGKMTTIFMHQLLVPGAECVDHIDGNGLNNRRANLRPATRAENCRNSQKSRRGKTSTFKGVSWHRGSKKFMAVIRFNYVAKYLGVFESEKDAAWAYDRAARTLFGRFARCNFAPPPAIWRPA